MDFFLVSSGSDNDCERCDLGCKKCSSKSNCFECFGGYYLSYHDENNITCSPCPLNCNACQISENSIVCINCSDGYYLNNNQCIKGKSPCEKCTSNNQCISCIDGYLFKDNSCELKC